MITLLFKPVAIPKISFFNSLAFQQINNSTDVQTNA